MLAGLLADMDEEIKNAGPNKQPVPGQSDPEYENTPD